MIFHQIRPGPALAPFVRSLWYVCAPGIESRRQRVLPTGHAQLVLNLAADTCIGCAEDGTSFAQAPALLVGVTPSYTLIDAADMEEMIGVVFAPGGLYAFFGEPAHRLSGEVPLEALWGAPVRTLRHRLRETPTAHARLTLFERFLLTRLLGRQLHPAVQFALHGLERRPGVATITRVAGQTGLSPRRLRDLFAESVGVTPKCFARIRRFQQATRILHAGASPRWAELALDLGYCDQAHFSNDFRAFSGMSPSDYLRADRNWANHVHVAP